MSEEKDYNAIAFGICITLGASVIFGFRYCQSDWHYLKLSLIIKNVPFE